MSLAARLKMFEQAATDNGAAGRPGSAAAPAKRPTWGASRGPSLAEQIKKVRRCTALYLALFACVPAWYANGVPGNDVAAISNLNSGFEQSQKLFAAEVCACVMQSQR